jgi:predicted nucleotidyltransferase
LIEILKSDSINNIKILEGINRRNKMDEGEQMINDDIIAIKDSILKTVGEDCEKIILFGSYAYGTPGDSSDYDVFVVLKDDTEKPILVLQNIYGALAQNPNYKAVDILANYKNRFELRSKLPTIERTIAQKGVVLYDRA